MYDWEVLPRLLILLAVCAIPAAAQQIDLSTWFPFNPAGPVAAGTAVDASDLLVDVPGEDPAYVIDRRGFLTAAPDGHFYFTNTGRRARFFGTNFTFHANFPPNFDAPQQPGEYAGSVPLDAAERLATRLARMGVNLVRFHHMDSADRPQGIFDPAYPNDTQHLDPLQLRLLEYLLYQHRRRGIYANINLHVSRFFRSGDGVADYNLFDDSSYNTGATQFDPVMIDLQKKYAASLLGHVNPYTGLRLADDPAVAFVEISNEDSLLFSFSNDELNANPARPDALPPSYSAQLDRLWNQWLARRYASDSVLAAAWQGSGTNSPNLLVNGGFEAGLQGWLPNLHSTAQASFTSPASDAYEGFRAARVDVTSITGTDWHVQLLQQGLSIQAGQRYEVTFAVKSTPGFPVEVLFQKDIEPYTVYAYLGEFNPTGDWQVMRASFRSSFTDLGHTQLVFNIGAATGIVWLDAVSFASVAPIGLAAGESMAAGTVKRPLYSDLGRYSDARMHDLVQFYFDAERAYFEDMARYLHETVGVHARVTGTAPFWFYPLDTEIQSGLDYVDNHLYFDHPYWPLVTPWSPAGWLQQNQPFAQDPFDALFNIAASAVAGKPFTLSETNQPFPNDYQAEWLLWMTSFGNFQDWDEVLQFDYGAHPDDYFPEVSRTWFSLAGDATLSAQMPVAARIFVGGQNRPAAERLALVAGHDELLLAGPGISAGDYFGTHGVNASAALRTAVRITQFSSGSGPQYALDAGPPAVLASDNGELTLDRSAASAPVFQVNSGSLHAVAGFFAGKTVQFPSMTVALGAGWAPFAAVTLQPLDRRPLDSSRRLLLSVLTRYQNTGMIWNADRTSVDDRWGGPPAMVEPAAGTITVRLRPDATFRGFALDAQGKRAAEIGGGKGEFQLALDTRQQQTVWYELAADPDPSAAVPAITPGGVVSSASYLTGVAPGMLFSIFGTGLARTTAQAQAFPLPVEMGGASVLIGGRPAPLLYVSPLQINAQVPYSIPLGEADVVVNSPDGASGAERVLVQPVAPGIFVAVPAAVRAGDYISVYATGLGLLAAPLAAGLPPPVIETAAQVTATLGGVAAGVTYAGTAPGLAGLNQVNVRVPAAVSPGAVPLVLQVGGRSSNAVTITVRSD